MIADSISPGAVKSEDEHRRDICTAGRWVHSRAFVASTDGNISVRLDSRRVLTSPTAIGKGMMEPDDLVITDLRGRKLAGRREASSELAMHNLFYSRRPDVNAVVHAHPPTATAFAAAGVPLNKALLSELIISLGCIPVAQYGTPGTQELSDALEPMVKNYHAILLANHGVVTCGPDLLTAFFPHGNGRALRAGVLHHRRSWGNRSCFLVAMWKNCSSRALVMAPRRRPRCCRDAR